MIKTKPSSFSKKNITNSLVYPQASIEKKIGMDVVRRWLNDACLSPMGRERVESMSFKTDFDYIRRSLGTVAEMKLVLEDERGFSLEGISDGRKHIGTLKVAGTFVDAHDLHSVRRALKVSADIVAFFNSDSNNWPILTETVEKIAEVAPVIKFIDRILDPTGAVKDNASPALADIRHRMSTIQSRISSAIRRIMNRAVSDGIIDPDTQPAVRSGRVVIPVAAMNKRRISGIVHDESATGKTYFIEPGEVVELGNEQRELEIDERREIVRILIEAADYLRPNVPELLNTFEVLGKLDFILAKAKFANTVGGELPQLSRESIVRWHDARHPVLRMSLEKQDRNVVPLDIELEKPDKRILVVSGPNAGGKSVVLKTVGLVQYMAQSGMLPPLDSRSVVGLFERLFVDIGDDQSIEDDLSTYSSHLKNMKYILSHANPRSLVLIDEFGSG
ncbi:MAG: endonuclease MutS2, partial [Muribaculaceae bacterium]|nr:endonuclease MutS2 [Muribaculaceae bacterium]